MKYKQYSPDPSEGGGAPATIAELPNDDGKKNEGAPAAAATPGSFLDDDFPDTLEEAEKMAKPVPKPSTDDEMNKKSAEADKGEPVAKEGEPTPAADEGKDDEKTGFEFEPPKPEAAAPAVEEESNWITLAKETGLGELKTDSFEEYNKLYQDKLKAEREAGKAEAAKQEATELLSKHGPLAVDLFKYLSVEGNTLETYLDPLKQYNEIIAMGDEDIVRLEFESRRYEKEVIDQKIETLKQEGKLKDTAYDFRKVVEGLRDKKQASVLAEGAAKFDQAKQTLSDQRKQEDSQVREALSRLKQFYGGNVTQEMRDELYKKWESGEFRRRMASDPDAVVRFMMSEEYGEKAVKTIRKMAEQGGRQGFRNKEVHNIQLPGGGSKGAKPVEHVDEWDAWKDGLEKSNR